MKQLSGRTWPMNRRGRDRSLGQVRQHATASSWVSASEIPGVLLTSDASADYRRTDDNEGQLALAEPHTMAE